PAPPADPGLTLSGVLIGEGVRKAYVTSRTDPRGAWVSEGDDVAGWKIKSVGALAITLEQQSRTIEGLLYPEKTEASPTPVGAAPARPNTFPMQNFPNQMK